MTFSARDYAAGGRQRLVQLSAQEFSRRWVQHVLPAGLVKVRHYGLLANRGRTERLALCRTLLGVWAVLQCVLGAAGGAARRGPGNRGGVRVVAGSNGPLWRSCKREN